jgi:hypothetical protein
MPVQRGVAEKFFTLAVRPSLEKYKRPALLPAFACWVFFDGVEFTDAA